MKTVSCTNFDEWKEITKELLHENVHPFDVRWLEKTEKAPFQILRNLFSKPRAQNGKTYRVLRTVADMAKLIACHQNHKKWDLLYSAAWRSLNGEPDLLDNAKDSTVRELLVMARQVKRDIRRMKCRVSFHAATGDRSAKHVAWYEPKHLILEEVAPFFKKFYGDFIWHLYTPQGSMHWDMNNLEINYNKPDLERKVDERLMLESLDLTYFTQLKSKLRWVIEQNPFALEFAESRSYETRGVIEECQDLCA